MWLNVLVLYVAQVLRRARRIASPGWRRLAADEAGQSMVEYAIVAALIAVVAMAAVQALGGGVAQVFQNILGHIQGIA